MQKTEKEGAGRKRRRTGMENKKDKERLSRIKWGNQLENLAIVILAFYPLRHINLGLDLWDTGYNYANFQYMGTKHMDSMWLFSTYLANALGNLLMKLPKANTLVGMNLYTGLLVSALALIGYYFCTRKMKMPKIIAFIGEMTAISLCWCPTALLYNYLTYLLFLVSSIFLYFGLTEEKKGYLICAGALLGANVLVRFSNLPEAAMIVAVWAYDFILWLEERGNRGRREGTVSRDRQPGFWRRTVCHTLWCLLGYAVVLAVLLNYIHICYGFGEYIEGIRRLFAMTDNAPAYKPTSMIMKLVSNYVENMYWVLRIGVIVAGGTILFAAAGWLEERCLGRFESIAKVVHTGARLFWAAVSVAVIAWLYIRGFCVLDFYNYDSIQRPGPVFLMLTILIAVVRIFHRRSRREEKLISGMLILIILLTPIGSNNGVLGSLNNLFLAAPYVLWESWRFLCYVGEKKGKWGLTLSAFPAKGVLIAILALCLFQFGAFGVYFAFEEAVGIQEADTLVENNAILRNVKMNSQRARWMTELSAYVDENELQGKEVILYGRIPALSYYLQMPSAFNPWSDLLSYGVETMEKNLGLLAEKIEDQGLEKPVIILENACVVYKEEIFDEKAEASSDSEKADAGAEKNGGMTAEPYGAEKSSNAAEKFGITEEERRRLDVDEKWRLLMKFMDNFGYEQTFRNEKFAVYR